MSSKILPVAAVDFAHAPEPERDERDDLLALVGHELRNPLHGLTLQVALAKTIVTPESPAFDRIARVEAALLRYSNRVTVLLELLSLRSGDYPAQRQQVDVAAVLRTIVDAESAQARARKVEVRVVGAARCMAYSDPVLLEEIFDNLLLNAFKHAACACVEVDVRCGDDEIEVSVSDDGAGIALEDQQRIFGKFEFARHSQRGSGSGLGLWIVRRLAHVLGGRVDLHSAPGAGSRFTVTIPRSPIKDAP